MSQIGYGIPWRVDGPLPNPPPYGLLQAAEKPAAGVQIKTDTDAAGRERWINGVEVYPYPPGPARVFDPCAPGSDAVLKRAGDDVSHPRFGAYTVYLPETCTAYKVWNQQEFKARAQLALSVYEGPAVAREFLRGDVLGLQPHLADGNGLFPNHDFSACPVNALALLEEQIGLSGQLGLVHMSPGMATALRAHLAVDDRDGVVRTVNGNVVVNDWGYAGGASPAGHHVATGTQQWMYATGSIDLRRSAPFVIPDDVAEALERGTGGAAEGLPNSITYRVERYYLVVWDGSLQAAVLADRCQETC